MPLTLPSRWQALVRGTPGRRFADRYHRTQRRPARQRWLGLLLRLVGAAVCFAIGIVLAVIPGPAVVFFFLTGILLASDWLFIARILDWLELRIRSVWKHVQRFWRSLPAAGRVALAIVGMGLSAASMYGFYRWMN